ncbi:MAG: TetR/AcrR family transcriptional regulator [Rhodospirillaceae bacterium]|jgi:AcrR family transcriptional regulator|nr:TetR/AcrR family transcriptional regulator [Rhodospirillaceae bacterium]
MAGLRERQKATRTQRILDEAFGLFRNVGYEAARIEDIAAAAELSVGTFYNYFPGKAEILLAMVTAEVEGVLASGERSLRLKHKSVAAALDHLIGGYYANTFVYTTKEMWRVAMAQVTVNAGTLFSRRYTDLDRRLTQQVRACLNGLQQKGMVLAGVDTDALGEMVFNNLNMMFIECVRSDEMTTDELRAHVARQNAPLARLISARQNGAAA